MLTIKYQSLISLRDWRRVTALACNICNERIYIVGRRFLSGYILGMGVHHLGIPWFNILGIAYPCCHKISVETASGKAT